MTRPAKIPTAQPGIKARILRPEGQAADQTSPSTNPNILTSSHKATGSIPPDVCKGGDWSTSQVTAMTPLAFEPGPINLALCVDAIATLLTGPERRRSNI